MKQLPEIFYTIPDVATTTMSRKDLRELLFQTDGKIISCGRLRAIQARDIGVGVYEVSLAPLEASNG